MITIGMPIFNGGETLERAVNSILNQTYQDFELIISDNCSNDLTFEICQKYVKTDKRISYFRQAKNIGASANFLFVLEKASSKYFMWAAADDFRTADFLVENIQFLENNPTFVASTTPNYIEGQENSNLNLITFAIQGDLPEKYWQFFNNCWKSHGIFYSVIRTDVLKACNIIGQTFIAVDWVINLYLISRGNIYRTKQGLAIFGAKGISSRTNFYRIHRTHAIEILIPFYFLSYHALKLSKEFSFKDKVRLLIVLLKLNLKSISSQIYMLVRQFFSKFTKVK
jgi:glycosyltransferase involved in cell wall biosynthesis